MRGGVAAQQFLESETARVVYIYYICTQRVRCHVCWLWYVQLAVGIQANFVCTLSSGLTLVDLLANCQRLRFIK